MLAASDLTYGYGPTHGGDKLFRDVSFKVPAGKVAGLVGANGVGKSTLMKILAGELAADPGGVVTADGLVLRMAQDVGTGDGTVRELLLATAPQQLAAAGRAVLEAERALASGDEAQQAAAGMALGEAIGTWSELGGYELEGRWDASCRRIAKGPLHEVGDRPAVSLSGGERKQLVLDALLSSEAQVLLLDEPDNFLDVPAKRRLEEQLRQTRKTVLVISHDRELLAAACDLIVTVEGDGAWVHGGSYATYAEARERRQELLGDRLAAWHEEEKRLEELVRTFKERARYAPDWARRADAMESRWRRHVDAGPPPPVADQQIRVRLTGGDSARRAVLLEDLALPGLVRPFSDEVHVGERVGLIGPNGTGKSHLLRLLAGEPLQHTGVCRLGPRVSPGLFTQLNARSDFDGATPLEVAERILPTTQKAMNALAAYRLVDAARRPVATLSGGQRARLEVLCLEHEGHNLLLLDEPTDNLDIPSCEALEDALEGFEGTVVAVSHDRRFLRRMDRFLLLAADGRVRPIASVDAALDALLAG